MRTRDETFKELDRSFKLLMDCLGQLTEEELTANPVAGRWTVKDVIAHVWVWGDEYVNSVKNWQTRRPWQEGVAYDDAWNEQQVTVRAAMPLIVVVDGLTGAHRRLMHLLDLAAPEALAAAGRAPWGEEMALIDFFYSCGEHYREHVAALKNYQEHCLECD